MQLRRILLLLVALVVAGATAFLARSWVEGQRRAPQATARPAPQEPRTMVLVAAQPMEPGTFVRASSLRWQPWPDVDIPSSYFAKGEIDPKELEGAVVRSSLDEGEPVTARAVVRPGERGFLAAVLEPGMQAVSVPIDSALGNAGLIFPGDHVDVILSQKLKPEAGPGPDRYASETVLEDVRVIAVGQRLATAAEGSSELPTKVRMIMLEVSPDGARRLALAMELGRLSLGIRSLARTEDATAHGGSAEPRPPEPVWDDDVSIARGIDREVRVYRGGDTERILSGGTASHPGQVLEGSVAK